MPASLKPKNFQGYDISTACLIIGTTALASFVLNALALALTPELYSVQWRVTFLEQVANRSIALLLGFGLIFYGLSRNLALRTKLAFLCLITGLLFQMGCILIIHDTLALQGQASENIAQQSRQAKEQIQENRSSLDDSQQADQAIRQIILQEEELQQRAKSDITRAGIVSLGNLFIPGIGLIGLGWLALK